MDKVEIFELKSVGPDTGRNGEDQWKLSGVVPWSQYVANFWLERAVLPEAPAPGVYKCLFERGALTKPSYDGGQDFMYKWRMVQFNTQVTPETLGNSGAVVLSGQPLVQAVTSPTAPFQTPTAPITAPITAPMTTGQADHPRKTESFERGRSLELAVSLLVADKIDREELFDIADKLYRFQSDPVTLTVTEQPVLEVEEEEEH